MRSRGSRGGTCTSTPVRFSLPFPPFSTYVLSLLGLRSDACWSLGCLRADKVLTPFSAPHLRPETSYQKTDDIVNALLDQRPHRRSGFEFFCAGLPESESGAEESVRDVSRERKRLWDELGPQGQKVRLSFLLAARHKTPLCFLSKKSLLSFDTRLTAPCVCLFQRYKSAATDEHHRALSTFFAGVLEAETRRRSLRPTLEERAGANEALAMERDAKLLRDVGQFPLASPHPSIPLPFPSTPTKLTRALSRSLCSFFPPTGTLVATHSSSDQALPGPAQAKGRAGIRHLAEGGRRSRVRPRRTRHGPGAQSGALALVEGARRGGSRGTSFCPPPPCFPPPFQPALAFLSPSPFELCSMSLSLTLSSASHFEPVCAT